MKYLSYRNLGEKGGPEFSEAEVKLLLHHLR
jgi:ubiquinol-cytochrome c reductase cytochrome c1 subunit